MYQAWSDHFGKEIAPPESLESDWEYRTHMEGLITHGEMDTMDEIQNKLTSAPIQAAYKKVHDHFAQSVERHEAQHRLDLSDLYRLPMPPALARYVGELPEGFEGKPGLASHALAETSAYLSELARDPLTKRVNLTLLATYLLNTRGWGMAESYAALVIMQGLCEELSIEHEEFVVRRRIQRDAVAKAYLAMVEVDREKLGKAATDLWQRFFAMSLPELELVAR
jgi:hypothetical protein